MSPFWKRFVGVSLADRYPLVEPLGDDESGAFFRTAGGPEDRAVVKLMPEDPATSAAQLSLWRRTRQLGHPNILRLLNYGRADAEGESLLYAVFEYPEDTAAGALRHGPMSEGEAREVLLAMAGALRDIHGAGLVHGEVDAEHILAVGDTIKLASDGLREPTPDLQPARDIRDLGKTVAQLLTRERSADSARLPEPFRSVVADALNGNATLEGMVARLVAPAPATAAAAVEPPKGPAVPAKPEPAPRPAVPPPPRTVKPAGPVLPARAGAVKTETAPRKAFPAWAYGALAVAVAGGIFAAHRASDSQPAAAPPSTTAAPASAPARTAPPPATPARREKQKEVAAAHPAPAAARSAPAETRHAGAWRVIAYTYAGKTHAEAKARSINDRWPEFHAEVFSPRGPDTSPYLVALGGRMSKSDAEKLRRQARSRGLPRDTFIRNY